MANRSSNFSLKDIGKSELEKVIRYDEGTIAWWEAHTALGGQNNDTKILGVCISSTNLPRASPTS